MTGVFTVIVTWQAANDSKRIYGYTARTWGKEQAARWQKELVQTMSMLETLPERHPVAPENEESAQTIRQIVRAPFRILFTIQGEKVQVLHIRHAARRVAGEGMPLW